MPKAKAKKKGTHPARGARKAARKGPRMPKRVREHFAEGLLRRGEAVPEPPPGTELPPGATHTFDPDAVKDGSAPPAGGLRRRRFSLL